MPRFGKRLRAACLELGEPLQAIDEDRDEPADEEDGDDQIAEAAEILVEAGNEAPERTIEAQLLDDETQGLDAADEQGDQHRHEGDGEVVVELAQRLREGPAIGANH